ncbi:hypothetical protein [Marinobacter sp. F4206]|uniref:hypothetical protein n=1 Tax=Marinobacter sp. F4206 TaxID=2861777 RepID=UPI001C5F52D4|nr:hypothetical protein [Marinobacter sp. F4206]MBW4935687.1 hypothetical protein [Marinobacter sp. F4206]
MKRLPRLSVFALTFTLAGCGEESDQLPVDGRDFDGVEYSDSAPYAGKVIDGYLNNARVWLDMDGDNQYSAGPLTITLENGADVVLESGEPTAMSGPGGEFSLDVSELSVDSVVGPDLDPRDYPLIALAIPGKTLEETRAGDVVITDAFMMSASPGLRNVTPLTTLARFRGLAGLLEGAGDDLADSLVDLNLVRDYVLAGDEQAHAYARALARFMASQMPQEYNDLLAAPGSDGTERFLSPQAAFLLGISVVQNANDVVAIVDEAAGGDYANVDVDSLALPEVPLELSDPKLVTKVRVLAQSERSGELPTNLSDLQVSATLVFDYSEAGRLQSVSAEGCMAPSMLELGRLVSVNGYMARLESQWLPSAALSSQSKVNLDNPGVDERLKFDWANRRIYFDTVTTCHNHEGIFADSSELGGTPEITYSWSEQAGGVVELVAQQEDPLLTRTLELVRAPDSSTAGISDFRLSEEGVELASRAFSGPVDTCVLSSEIAGLDQVVSATRPYDIVGYEPQPSTFVDPVLEFDARVFTDPESGEPVSLSRPLRFGFLDPSTASLGNVSSDGGFEWVMYYASGGQSAINEVQPNLIETAYLKNYGGVRACAREFEEAPSGAFAVVEYGYQSLSDYLLGLLQ